MGLNIFLFKNKVSVVGVFFCPYAKKNNKKTTPLPPKKLALKATCSIIQQQLKLVFIIVKK